MSYHWPHSPSHCVTHPGAYIITASTLHHELIYGTPDRLAHLEAAILKAFSAHGWEIQAWAVFPNHYHLVAFSPEQSGSSTVVTNRLHSTLAKYANDLDGTPGRKVWFQRFDTRLTFEKSYLARLKYVHHNAVRHGLVSQAEAYPYCSARWFAETATVAFREVVESFKIDRVQVQGEVSRVS